MSARKPVKFPLRRLYQPNEWVRTTLDTAICTSTIVPPPARWDASMTELCVIKCETDIDINSLPTFTNKLGKVIHKLGFQVEMTCTGGLLDFAVYHEGKRQGHKHAVVDYETRS